MYEMRYASADRREAVWHVLAKEAASGTLCGLRLVSASKTAPAGAGERYCAACMEAFGAVMHGAGAGPAVAGRASEPALGT
ncbi:hypothetical protein ABZ128_32445 [Streptomyces sp. NPDC006326]|uniref:hypothetical protein n=1 Tax=Streptomyces sp. NPDC006326 TaxID=3156752 RepID=UPI0033BF1729